MSVTKIYLSPKKVAEVNKDPGRGEDDLQVCLEPTAVGWGRARACESRPFTTATPLNKVGTGILCQRLVQT